MKYLALITALLFISPNLQAMSSSHDTTSSNNQWIIDDLVKKWEGNKAYTLAILDLMPEEKYAYQPTEDTRTFEEQASHIANGFSFQLGLANLEKLEKIEYQSKSQYLADYTLIFDALIAKIKSMNPEKLNTITTAFYGETSRLRVLNLLDHHLAHHRGQMIVYLRMNGIKPPRYVGW